MKEITTTQKHASDAQIEKMEKELAKMRDLRLVVGRCAWLVGDERHDRGHVPGSHPPQMQVGDPVVTLLQGRSDPICQRLVRHHVEQDRARTAQQAP